MNAKDFGVFILELRKEKGLTQAELAQKLHVTDKAVSRWERGLGFPDINTLEPLADALGVSLTELMKCQKMTGPEVNIKEAENMISAGIDIAKYQRDLLRRKVFSGLITCLSGVFFVVLAAFLYFKNSFAISMMSSADGPTSVFIAGKIGTPLPLFFGIAGALLLLFGIIKLVKK